MHLTDIELENFRNYADVRIQPEPGMNVLFGRNAQGKTNILEAIHICCLGKSHRGAHDQELVRRGQKSARIWLRVHRKDSPRTIEVLLQGGKKRVSVSGVPIKRMAELMGHINCVLFSPEDLSLVKGGPGTRRRFLDTSLCQLRPRYYSALASYNHALAQRNALLRSARHDPAMLDVFEQALAEHGQVVVTQRAEFVRQLQQAAPAIHAELSGGEALALQYKGSGQTQDELLDALLAAREDDLRRQSTSVGPHRHDIQISIDALDARQYGSQGQQRTAALALKLGGAKRMEAETGEKPIILLDDVLSELDCPRQHALMSLVSGQVLITSACLLPETTNASPIFKVENGAVARVEA